MKVAIASGKGGTGKTTISTNLATYIAETEKVILVDLDVEEPNSKLFIKADLLKKEDKFKMIPKWNLAQCTLCGICQEVCNYNSIIQAGNTILVFPELCHSCYACSELCPTDALPMIPVKMGELKHYKLNNLDFIESMLDIGQELAVPLIAQTIDYVDNQFSDEHIKIYDSPPGTSCPVIEATKDADYVILVTEPTPFGLNDLKLAVETMLELKKEFGVVINRNGLGNTDVEKYCINNKIPVIAKIPNSKEIATYYSKGILIYSQVKEFKNELKKIKNYILNKRHIDERGSYNLR
ncbi:MAG: ATP-binding protein [Bacteroidales bacterium]|nr:ATP-binding protein [Bacteroidales bacterium]